MQEFIIPGAVAATAVIGLLSAVKVVPQTRNYVVERFGKYRSTLHPGLHFIVPGIDSLRHKVSILERQLEEYPIDAITSDNAPISVTVATFFRVVDAHKCVYRIRDIDKAVQSLVTGAVRSVIGEYDFDNLQSNRAKVSGQLAEDLAKQAEEWGIEITRCEIQEISFDANTREALQRQISAERERRASVTKAEGEKRAIELKADGELYAAQKEAEARRIRAEAEAYAAETIAKAINEGGDEAMRFDLVREQILAMREVGKSQSTKTIIMPSEMTGSLTGLAAMFNEFMGQAPKAKKDA